jgi:peptide/nickel transport system substrate-binding protein
MEERQGTGRNAMKIKLKALIEACGRAGVATPVGVRDRAGVARPVGVAGRARDVRARDGRVGGRAVRTVWQAAALGVVLLAARGCGGGAEDAGARVRDLGGGVESAFAAEAGRPGGALVIGSVSGPKTFNPIVSSETSSSDIWHLMFDRLVGFDPIAREFTPRMADSWTRSGDGLSWTFHLREGLRWSDGGEVTSGDVTFAFEVIYDDGVPAVGRETLSLEGRPFDVTAIDERTVRISTQRPYGPMLYALSAAFWPLPRHVLEGPYREGRFAEAMSVGTPPAEIVVSGPFRLELSEPGRTVLSPNPNYWRVDANGTRLPYLERVVFVETGDWNSWRLRFESGELDYYLCRPDEVSDFREGRARGDYTTFDLGLETGTTHFWYNLNPGADARGRPYVDPEKLRWFSDVRFRRATSHGIDRESIVRAVYHGWGGAIYGPTSPVDKLWYNSDILEYSYDPAKAGRLLDDMGLVDRDEDGVREDRDGTDVRFTFMTNVETPARVAMGNMIAMDLKAIGIDAVFKSLDFNTVVSMIGDSYRYDACLLSVTAGPDPVGGLDVWLSSGWMHAFNPNQASPGTRWEAEVDRLVFQNLTGLDYAERKAAWDKVQTLYAENLGFIFVANQRTFVAVRDKFGNLKPQPYQEWHRAAWNADEIYVRVRA